MGGRDYFRGKSLLLKFRGSKSRIIDVKKSLKTICLYLQTYNKEASDTSDASLLYAYQS